MREPVCALFNVAVNQIARRLMPKGWDVAEDAPDNYDALVRHYNATGRILVWSGASDKTQFADVATNHAFRAWHDYRHITQGADFSREGETLTYEMQRADLAKWFGMHHPFSKWRHYCQRLLRIEVIGQLDYADTHGGAFPVDQWKFTKAELMK